MGKQSERRRVPEEAVQLIELIVRELQSPADMQSLLDGMPPTAACHAEAADFLKAKDRAARRQSFIKTEPLWYGKYGWFMARIVILFGLLTGLFTLVARGTADFAIMAILGAAAYYLLLVTFSNLRYREGNRKRARLLKQEEERYQRDIVPVATALLKRYQLDPKRFPVANPRSPAGLERREDGFYIPLD